MSLARRFHDAFPSRLSWRTVGREAEHPVVHPDGRGADISVLWDHLKGDDLRPLYEGELLVGLEGPDYTFSAEVGRGTMEIVTAPRDDLIALARVYETARDRLVAAAAAEDLVVLGYGVQPLTAPTTSWMSAKQRYGVLLDVIGPPWLWFALTASDQIHAAVTRDEWVRVTNIGNLLAPVIVALTANSSVMEGADTGVMSAREHLMGRIGEEGHRHGMPAAPIRDADDHVERLTALPHLMVNRNGTRHPGSGSFAEHATTVDDPEAVWSDFLHHEHYVWHTARPRSTHGTVEIRAACQQPGAEHAAASALCLGLIQGHVALEERLHDLLGDDPWPVMRAWHGQVVREGLRAEEPVPGLIQGVLRDVTDALGARGRGEERLTEPLWSRLHARSSPARAVRKAFDTAGVEGVIAETRLDPGRLTDS